MYTCNVREVVSPVAAASILSDVRQFLRIRAWHRLGISTWKRYRIDEYSAIIALVLLSRESEIEGGRGYLDMHELRTLENCILLDEDPAVKFAKRGKKRELVYYYLIVIDNVHLGTVYNYVDNCCYERKKLFKSPVFRY